MYDKDCSVADGKIESTNFTKAQRNYAEILSQIGRLAKYVEMRTVQFWVEKPDGYNEMMKALSKDGKAYDTLTPTERETYEKNYRYEKIKSQRLGGSQVLLQHMLYEVHQDPDVKKLWQELVGEIKVIASKEATDYQDGRDDSNLDRKSV